MNSIPLHLLEGLIHNLRSPLNVVIGYSQKTPDASATKHIYAAGIRMDDLLQQLLDNLNVITEEVQAQSLSMWLEAELGLIKHILPLKRQFRIETQHSREIIKGTFSGQKLSQLTHEVLLHLTDVYPQSSMELSFILNPEPSVEMVISLPHPRPTLLAEVSEICSRHCDQTYLTCSVALEDMKLSLKVKVHE